MWGRLQTRDKLRKIGLQVESNCPMCGLHTQTADHLLVQCIYFTDLGSMSNWLHKPTVGMFRCQGSVTHYNSVVKQIKNDVWMIIQSIMPKKV
ncbi:DNA ligase [Bienertia sinuspersici]